MPTWLSLLLVGVGVLGAVVLLLWIYDETACPRWAGPSRGCSA